MVEGRSLGRKRRLSRIVEASSWSMESINMQICFPVLFACWSKAWILFSRRVCSSLNPVSRKSSSSNGMSSGNASLGIRGFKPEDSERSFADCSSMKAIICFIIQVAWLVMGV